MEVLYFDNHLIAVHKPSGLSTEGEESVESWVKEWAKKTYQKPGNVFVRAVHRLDKPVSGVLLLAKTSKALVRLHAAFREKRVTKKYLGLVEGVLTQEEGVMEDYLVHGEFRAEIGDEKTPGAKKALLRYKVKEKDLGKSLVEIELCSGRYHQIRAQFSSRGHPIVGDEKYGARSIGKKKAIALHQETLTFTHPVFSKEVSLFASPGNWLETFFQKEE